MRNIRHTALLQVRCTFNKITFGIYSRCQYIILKVKVMCSKLECQKDIHFKAQPGPFVKNATQRPPAWRSMKNPWVYVLSKSTRKIIQLLIYMAKLFRAESRSCVTCKIIYSLDQLSVHVYYNNKQSFVRTTEMKAMCLNVSQNRVKMTKTAIDFIFLNSVTSFLHCITLKWHSARPIRLQ